MDTQAGFIMSQVKNMGGRVFEKILVQENIDEFNGAQGKILYALWKKDKISIVELSELVGLANTTLTSMLDRMSNAGLIVRLQDKFDRRKNIISLTDKANGLRERYEQVSQKMNNIYFRGFNEKEIFEFEQFLQRIINNLKEEI